MMMALIWKTKEAGGIDPSEPIYPILPAIAATVSSMSDRDIAHSAYVFNYLASQDFDSSVRTLTDALATEYAHRFSKWLAFVFMNRANRTVGNKHLDSVEEGIGNWVESIPSMLTGGQEKSPSDFVPDAAEKYLLMDKIDALGAKVVRVVRGDWQKAQRGIRTADTASLQELPITYDPKQNRYEIPTSRMTYVNRAKLKELGFEYTSDCWYTKVLDSNIMQAFPQVAKLEHGRSEKAVSPPDPNDWFFNEWLPANLARFTKAFDSYGRSEKVPYHFRFQLAGREVVVEFKRNVASLQDAIGDLYSRYKGKKERQGWLEALEIQPKLAAARGKEAIRLVDLANGLEHSHGSMMEHFPPGIRSWYPRFLDFKFTAHPWQMIRAIGDEDVRDCAKALLPQEMRPRGLIKPRTDYRTPKGLVTEITSQPGKVAKKKMLIEVLEDYPEHKSEIFRILAERGMQLIPEQVAWQKKEEAEAAWAKEHASKPDSV